MPSSYPSGPYGTRVGDVIANMHWIGYVDPMASAIATNEPYVIEVLETTGFVSQATQTSLGQ